MYKFAIGDVSDESKSEEKMKIPRVKVESRPIQGQIAKQACQDKSNKRWAVFPIERKNGDPEALQQKASDHNQKNEEQGHIIPHFRFKLRMF